jgi:hypothetical protein
MRVGFVRLDNSEARRLGKGWFGNKEWKSAGMLGTLLEGQSCCP